MIVEVVIIVQPSVEVRHEWHRSDNIMSRDQVRPHWSLVTLVIVTIVTTLHYLCHKVTRHINCVMCKPDLFLCSIANCWFCHNVRRLI